MPTTDFTIRAGTTSAISMQLLTDADADGIAESGINLSAAHHVEMVLRNTDVGTATTYSTLDSSPKVAILGGTAGSVTFTPSSGTIDLPLRTNGESNTLNGYFWVYTTATSKYAVPETFEFSVKVRS